MISEELIQKSCNLSLQVRHSPDVFFLVEKLAGSAHAFFSFPGSWSVESWYSGEKSFGETNIDLQLFPSLKSIGNYDRDAKPEDRELAIAFVNQAFLQKFEHVLKNSNLQILVQEALTEQRTLVFTGHSTGGATAVLATIWLLQNNPKANTKCITFGSPLIGNHLISHALRREKWSQHFIHCVMRHDIIPRILLAPLLSIEQEFHQILRFFDPKSPTEPLGTAPEKLYENVMRNASTLTSHVASKLMGSTNLLLESFKQFVELSPYKPFGTYVFYNGNGKMVVSTKPDVVLQILSYSCRLSNEAELSVVSQQCVKEHLEYGNEFQGAKGSLNMKNVVDVDLLDEVSLTSVDAFDLGLGVRARLCISAARESEMRKQKNQEKITTKLQELEKDMKKLEDYRDFYKNNVGYYDGFKRQNEKRDFEANVSRLALAGAWDEVIEMLKTYDLPDEFEATEEWIKVGTRHRHLVEPLDIANYYRHAKGGGSNPYMKFGIRPKRYRYPQRWLEHQQKVPVGSCGESWFWADVEELLAHTSPKEKMYAKKEAFLELQKRVGQWIKDGKLSKDVLLEQSTFVTMWDKLPIEFQTQPIIGFMEEQRRMQT